MNAIPAAPAVRVLGLTRRFGERAVLDRLDLDLTPGSFTALLGRSGSGKTTLLRTLAGLDPPPADAIVEVPRPTSVVFQEPRLLPWKRVWRNVALGLGGPDPRNRALTALREVGLAGQSDTWPATLSGGEAQRAAFARALVREPRLLLLDEPFAALDALTRIRMHGLVLDLWRAHAPATLIVTHDVDEALLLADRALVLASGRIAADIPVTLPRPRAHTQPGFVALRHRLLAELGVEDEEPFPIRHSEAALA
ncbi:MAG: ABC transporter ATP-binding protein [Acetobacteraceae bacterium]|nr:ABC transporter ATP-binding protein [Acetobacteraceae bacterium]